MSGLPKDACEITIWVLGQDFKADWRPFTFDDYNEENLPPPNFMGTATIKEGTLKGVGMHAYQHTNEEFVFYKL